jgi:hypothetical protein
MIDPTPLRALGTPDFGPDDPAYPDMVIRDPRLDLGNLGIITDEVTMQLGSPVALGDTVVMGIPLRTWLIVGLGAALGGTGGAYLATRTGRGAVGGALGAAAGAMLGMVVVNLTKPKELTP